MKHKFANDNTINKLFCRATLLLIALTIPSPAWAQSGTKSTPADNLNKFRSRLKDSIRLLDRSRTPADQQNGKSSTAEDRGQRIQSIQNRIDLLKKLMREQAEAEAANKNSPMELGNAGQSNNELRNFQPDQETATPAQTPAPKLKNSEPPPQPETTTEVFPTELTVPVNTAELAHSLFLAGNWEEALERYQYYQQQDELRFKEDIWAKCMMANCYRLKGDLNNAEAHYRELVALKNEAYPVKISMWYLSYLTKRKQLKSDFQALAAEADSLLLNAEITNEQ